MTLVVLLLLALVAVAVVTGRVADSRHYADWRPTLDGVRQPPAPVTLVNAL